jgi:hypothetical protein
MDQDRLTEHRALEFAALAAAIETLLRPSIRATKRSAQTRGASCTEERSAADVDSAQPHRLGAVRRSLMQSMLGADQ